MTVTQERLQHARVRAAALGLTRLSLEDLHVLALAIAREPEMAADLPTDLHPEEEPAYQFRITPRIAGGDPK